MGLGEDGEDGLGPGMPKPDTVVRYPRYRNPLSTPGFRVYGPSYNPRSLNA